MSKYVGGMPLLVVTTNDVADPTNERGSIERSAIALPRNYCPPSIDAPSEQWLGLHSSREHVRESGLWINNYVDEDWSIELFDVLDDAIAQAGRLSPTV